MTKNALHHYYVHGLHIASELACPELKPILSGCAPPDATIRFGSVPSEIADYVYNDGWGQIKPSTFLLQVMDIGNLIVMDGCEMIIDPDPACAPELFRLYIYSQGFGALLLQRGRLILHASAVESDQGAVVFVGPSGVGKSTLAAGFMQAGYPILTEDLCAIGLLPGDRPQMFPAFAQIRLWRDVVEKLGYDRESMRPVWHKQDKYTVPIEDRLPTQPIPINAIYLLNPADVGTVSIERLSLKDQFAWLRRNIYRAEFIDGLGVQEQVFGQIAELMRRCPVKRVTRPHDPFSIHQLIQHLEDDFG